MWCKQKRSRTIVSVQDTLPPSLFPSPSLTLASARTSIWLSCVLVPPGGGVKDTLVVVVRASHDTRPWRTTRRKASIPGWGPGLPSWVIRLSCLSSVSPRALHNISPLHVTRTGHYWLELPVVRTSDQLNLISTTQTDTSILVLITHNATTETT